MHDMKLHTVMRVGRYRIIRVPGGWIYERIIRKLSDTENEVAMVFVPYSEEFRGPA